MFSASEMDNANLLQQLSDEFDTSCQARHEMGEVKYGAGTFLKTDTLQHALDEVTDLANYARYTYIKLRLMQLGIAEYVPNGEVTEPIVDSGSTPHQGLQVPDGFYSWRSDRKRSR